MMVTSIGSQVSMHDIKRCKNAHNTNIIHGGGSNSDNRNKDRQNSHGDYMLCFGNCLDNRYMLQSFANVGFLVLDSHEQRPRFVPRQRL